MPQRAFFLHKKIFPGFKSLIFRPIDQKVDSNPAAVLTKVTFRLRSSTQVVHT